MKKAFGAQTWLYPEPVVLVGANVAGKANFATVAWVSICCAEPPCIAVALRKTRHTLKGIMENRTFSVNIPSEEQVEKVDFCGIISGSEADKVATTSFTIFYGKLKSAPLIEECPVGLECEVVKTLELGSHILIVGRIAESYVSEACLTDGKPDTAKIRPMAYTPRPNAKYHALGRTLGDAFSVGKRLARS